MDDSIERIMEARYHRQDLAMLLSIAIDTVRKDGALVVGVSDRLAVDTLLQHHLRSSQEGER